MLTDSDRVPLASRAMIGDGVTAALVAADGTIDWYCPGGFDHPASLARLLDPRAGAVRVGPVRTGTAVRRRLPAGAQSYRDGSLVVDTELATGGARLLVVDFMPWAGPGVTPPGRIVRVATALAGPVDVEVEVIPGGLWGPARAVSGWSEGMVADRTVVHAGFPLESDALDRDHPRWRGVRRLDTGESMVVTIDDGPLGHHPPLSVDAALGLAEQTVTAWRSWLGPVVYDGGYGPALRRSALTVRALTSPAGGPVAAATTSLPRRVGGERSIDDRVVRLTDAATASRTLASIGLSEDAEAAERWLRAAVEGAATPWPVELDVEGGPVAELEELTLPGWRRSEPVVTGAVPGIVDHDLYGNVVSAISASRTGPWGAGDDGPLVGAWPGLVEGADWLTDHWHEPDAGRWGSTGRPVRLVASAVQAWVALDGMTRRAQAANPLDLAVVPWHRAARDILEWLETDGLGDDDALRRDPLPGDRPDAALLRVAWRGPWPAVHPIVTRTVDRTIERLESGYLLYRLPAEVDDGRPGPDNPDLLASLWAVRALARLERWEEAHERMEAILALAGGSGLLSEAADPTSGELLGNLPASAVHLAVIDAAGALTAGPR
jgi:GH15 family glucan-1,4-alpha-glucosidase